MSSVLLRERRNILTAERCRDCLLSRHHIRCVLTRMYVAEPDVASSATLVVLSVAWFCALLRPALCPGNTLAAAVVLVYDWMFRNGNWVVEGKGFLLDHTDSSNFRCPECRSSIFM